MTSACLSCTIADCKRPARTICICCEKTFCSLHLKEHEDELNAEIIQIANKIATLLKKLNDATSVEVPTTAIEKWRKEAHHLVNYFCDRKLRELVEARRDEQRKKVNNALNRARQLIRDKDATKADVNLLSRTTQSIERKLDELQNLQLNIRSLVIDDNRIVLREELPLRDLFPLSPPYQRIPLKWFGSSLATTDKHLLLRQNSNLCLLDRQLTIIKEVSFTHGDISDMFWSSTLARFFIIVGKEIFTCDERAMSLEKWSIPAKSYWGRGTCSDTKLFLTILGAGSPIYAFNLLPSIQFVKQWQSPVTCQVDEYIEDLKCLSGSVALIISNRQTRLELRSPTTLGCLWSIEIGLAGDYYTYCCCSINTDQWLVVDKEMPQLWHVSADGKILKKSEYSPKCKNAVQWGNDLLVIRTKDSIILHELIN